MADTNDIYNLLLQFVEKFRYVSLHSPILDLSEPLTVSTTSETAASKIWNFVVMDDFVKLTELDVMGDATFASAGNGKIKITIKGQVATRGGFVSLVSSILGGTFDLRDLDIILERGDEVAVYAVSGTGTGTVQVQMTAGRQKKVF